MDSDMELYSGPICISVNSASKYIAVFASIEFLQSQAKVAFHADTAAGYLLFHQQLHSPAI